MSLSHKLQEYRQSHKLSQEELASQLGVSRQSVSKWEQGLSFPETEKLITLSTMMGTSIDSLLKDTPDEPTVPSAEAPVPTPEPVPVRPWLNWLGVALVVLLAVVAIASLYREPASPTPPTESTPPAESTQPPETTTPPETTLPAETEPVPDTLTSQDLMELQTWFFDFAREYRLDYLPQFTREDGPPTDSGEYLYWIFATNRDMLQEENNNMTRSFVDEVVWNFFRITPNMHRSHHKQWNYDETTEIYTPWPEGMKSEPYYLLNSIEISGGTYTIHATCYSSPYHTETGDEMDTYLRQALLSGMDSELTPTAEITLVFSPDPGCFYAPVFDSFSATEYN